MDTKFHPAIAAVRSGDLEKFRSLIAADPSLATSRSSTSHPTLLQCVVLDGNDRPNNVEMAEVLIEAGAELNEPMIATGSINNRAVAELLLDRGAKVLNLRVAAALGRIGWIENAFNADGSLKPEAGRIDWPFRSHEPRVPENYQQAMINNAFVYACMQGRMDAAQ